MICSFVVALRPKDEKPIYKYINFRYIKELLKNEMGIEDLKKITISNFLTKDKFFGEKTYYIKISSIDSECTVKLLKNLFLYKITNQSINIKDNDFKIVNIYHNKMWCRQMLEIEKFIEETKLKNEIEINIITPIFFKIGNEFVVSSEPLYTFKNLIKKIKISSLKDNKIIFELLKNFDIKKIKIKENSTKNIFLKEYNSYGMTGKIVFEIENYTENELILFNFLIYFSFFSSIGYATEKGYGQINIKI